MEINEYLIPTMLMIFAVIIIIWAGKIEVNYKDFKITIEKQGKQINKQQNQISMLVKYSLSEELYKYLTAMNTGREFIFHDNVGFKNQLEYLINNNYINRLKFDSYSDKDNIITDTILTEKGREYLLLRKNA